MPIAYKYGARSPVALFGLPCTAGVQGHVDVRRRQARKHAMAPTARSAPLENFEPLAKKRKCPFP